MIKNKIHPTNVISGIKLASKKAQEFLKNELRIKTETLGKDALVNVAKTSMASKVLGPESDYFGNIVVDALLQVKALTNSGKEKYSVKSVNILKQHGKSAKESQLVKGMFNIF